MKKTALIVCVVLGVAFAGLAQAAPRKQKKQNRVGPYAAFSIGMTEYSDDGANAQALLDILDNNDITYQNVVSKTDDTDINYQITFGYRFHRYFAAEIGLFDYGKLKTTTHADMQFPDVSGTFAGTNELDFKIGGPQISVLGILPISNSFEMYARLGYLFASTTQDLSVKVQGATALAGSNHDSASLPLFGVGMSFNLNQVYAIHVEYDRLTDVGKSVGLDNEDVQAAHLGVVMRF